MAETIQGTTVSDAAPLVVFADDWGRHPSSCQHLFRRLQGDRTILWVNTIGTRQVKADRMTVRRGIEKLRNWTRGLTQVAERMWVTDLPMLPGLSNRFSRSISRAWVGMYLRRILSRLKVTQPIVLTTLPYIGWLIRDVQRQGLIYYCTDDYSHWPSADGDTLRQAEQELLVETDVVLAASNILRDRLQKSVARCEYFPHGVDFEHFAAVQSKPAAHGLSSLTGPRIGFFGLIYEKLDFSLLCAIARRFSSGHLVMIGPVDHCPTDFSRLPNVHFLGPKPYASLPDAIAGLDLLLLPYVDDPMIRQSGPLKLRECLATGLPTVSVDVPEVRSLQPHVRIGKDTEGFLEQIEQGLQERGAMDIKRARQAAVRNDSWDNRAADFRSYLDQIENNPKVKVPRRRRKRVLHLRTIRGKGGGPEKTLLNNPRFLKESYHVRLAYIRPENDEAYDMTKRASAQDVELADIPERTAADVRTLWRLAREINLFRPDLLHAHDYKTNLLGLLLARCFRIPVVTTLHGYVSRGGRLEFYYLVDRLSLPLMDHVVSVSTDLDCHANSVRVPKVRRSLIENAIDTDDFHRRTGLTSAKAKLGIPNERFSIGAVGRLSEEKGFDVLIRAVHLLLQQGANLELLIAGTGDAEPNLRTLIANLGLDDRVRLLGHLSDVRPLFEALDVFALSSYREGLPNVLLEAMALEVPVVATRVNGVPRLVRDNENGLLVEPGSVAALASGLRMLCDDANLRTRLAAAGRQTVVEQFSFRARMAKVRGVYDSLLGRSPRRHRPLTRETPGDVICGA